MIQLTKDLWLKADEYCYIVGKPRQDRGKSVELRSPTYYTTATQAVSGACARALRQGVADGSITTLREFIREQERLRAELETLIAPLDSGEARQRAVEIPPTAPMGNYTSQPSNDKKEE